MVNLMRMKLASRKKYQKHLIWRLKGTASVDCMHMWSVLQCSCAVLIALRALTLQNSSLRHQFIW